MKLFLFSMEFFLFGFKKKLNNKRESLSELKF